MLSVALSVLKSPSVNPYGVLFMHCGFVHGLLVVNPDLVLCYWKVDATRHDGLARFINHSCDVRPYSFFTLLLSLAWW